MKFTHLILFSSILLSILPFALSSCAECCADPNSSACEHTKCCGYMATQPVCCHVGTKCVKIATRYGCRVDKAILGHTFRNYMSMDLHHIQQGTSVGIDIHDVQILTQESIDSETVQGDGMTDASEQVTPISASTVVSSADSTSSSSTSNENMNSVSHSSSTSWFPQWLTFSILADTHDSGSGLAAWVIIIIVIAGVCCCLSTLGAGRWGHKRYYSRYPQPAGTVMQPATVVHQPMYGSPQYAAPGYVSQPAYAQPYYSQPTYGQPTYGRSSGVGTGTAVAAGLGGLAVGAMLADGGGLMDGIDGGDGGGMFD